MLIGFFGVTLITIAMALPSSSHAEEIVIHTESGPHTFSIEVMRTGQERAQGLMNRQYLAPEAGMLFDFGDPRPVSMWMKNTYISLDMIFISKDGVVRSIAENTTPLSTKIISSKSQVRYVLEVNGGTASRLGVKPGDRVTLPE